MVVVVVVVGRGQSMLVARRGPREKVPHCGQPIAQPEISQKTEQTEDDPQQLKNIPNIPNTASQRPRGKLSRVPYPSTRLSLWRAREGVRVCGVRCVCVVVCGVRCVVCGVWCVW